MQALKAYGKNLQDPASGSASGVFPARGSYSSPGGQMRDPLAKRAWHKQHYFSGKLRRSSSNQAQKIKCLSKTVYNDWGRLAMGGFIMKKEYENYIFDLYGTLVDHLTVNSIFFLLL